MYFYPVLRELLTLKPDRFLSKLIVCTGITYQAFTKFTTVSALSEKYLDKIFTEVLSWISGIFWVVPRRVSSISSTLSGLDRLRSVLWRPREDFDDKQYVLQYLLQSFGPWVKFYDCIFFGYLYSHKKCQISEKFRFWMPKDWQNLKVEM